MSNQTRKLATSFLIGVVIGLVVLAISAFIDYYRQSPYRYDIQG